MPSADTDPDIQLPSPGPADSQILRVQVPSLVTLELPAPPEARAIIAGGASGFYTSSDGRVSGGCLQGSAEPPRRENNEDALAIMRDPTSPDHRIILAVDGMGGHLAGECASYFVALRFSDDISAGKDLLTAAQNLQQGIAGYAKTIKDNHGYEMGAAYCAVRINESTCQVEILHQGDVAAMRVASSGEVPFETNGHSLGRYLYEHQKIKDPSLRPKDIIRGWNTLTNYVGFAAGRPLQDTPETNSTILAPGDWLIVASDGLSKIFDTESIGTFARWCETPSQLAELLFAEAREAMETNPRLHDDNITIAVYRRPPGDPLDLPVAATAAPLPVETVSPPASEPPQPTQKEPFWRAAWRWLQRK